MGKASRNTIQKELISEAIEKTEGFFTADDLAQHLEGISLATVYRHLKFLRKQKVLHSYSCKGRQIYSKDQKSHCHFICEKTGKVLHFSIDSLDFLKDKIPGTITSFQIEVRGRCNDCIESERKKINRISKK